MHQRFTTYVTTGIGVPPSVQTQNDAFIPQIGGALFASAANAATALAKREVARTLRQVRSTADKEFKRLVADWFLVESLLSNLATEATMAAPASLKPLARKGLRADDQWGAFAVLGAWQLRECVTKRVPPQDMPPSPKVGARKLARKRSRVTRKSIQTLVSSYEAVRRPPSAAFAEHEKNDPLAKFRKAIVQIITAHQGSQPRKFPALVRADIQGNVWPSHSPFFLSIPFEARLGLTLSMLLRLHADHTVWTHRIDFVIEPLLRAILREARRHELARQLRTLSSRNLTEAAAYVTSNCAYNTAMGISTALTVGTTSFVIAPALHAAVDTAASANVQINGNELLSLVGAVDAAAFDVASRTLTRKWILAIVGDLRRKPSPPQGLDFAEGTAAPEPSPVDGDNMMNVMLASLPQAVVDAVLGVANNAASIASAAAPEVVKSFDAPPAWSVAMPIENWAADQLPSATPTGSLGSLTTIDALEANWKPPRALAPAAVPGKPRARLTKSSLCLVASEIVAPSDQLAVREAQARLDANLCGLWFLDDRRYSARLSNYAFVRRATDGRITQVGIAETKLSYFRNARSTEFQALTDIASTLATRWRDLHQRDMWRRVSEGIGFLRSAVSATLFYERYLFLWMALEALLNNLEIDDKDRFVTVPIGTRVAYRASLLLVPDPAMKGRTFGEARWVTALEFGALYHLRNKAVHEGRRNPPIDETILDRFQRRVVMVFEIVARNAFQYGMRRIEELLAWCADKYPETDPIP
jgi:hypothetical protein